MEGFETVHRAHQDRIISEKKPALRAGFCLWLSLRALVVERTSRSLAIRDRRRVETAGCQINRTRSHSFR